MYEWMYWHVFDLLHAPGAARATGVKMGEFGRFFSLQSDRHPFFFFFFFPFINACGNETTLLVESGKAPCAAAETPSPLAPRLGAPSSLIGEKDPE
jgi:hypothetical protein